MRRLLGAPFGLALLLAPPPLALAQELTGGCTVTANSGVDATTVRDATRDNPFDVDPEGDISWQATSPAPIKDHTWSIWVDIAGFPLEVAEGAEANDAGTQTNSGERHVAEETNEIEEMTGLPVDQIRGTFLVGGEIAGTGGTCSGSGYLRILGGIFDTWPGIAGIALAVLGAIMFGSAGVRKKR